MGILRKEPLRLAAQTTVGATAAYLIAQYAGLPEPSWSVFSALFVIQASVGGTIQSAVWRIMGAGLGLVLGLVAIFLLGSGGWDTLWSLMAGSAAMGFVAAAKPGLSYGLVTVTMLILAPGIEVIEGAFIKAVEIALGAVCGATASLVVFPRAAHRQADLHLAEVLHKVGDFLKLNASCIAAGQDRDLAALQSDVEDELDKARQMAAQAHRRFVPGRPDERARDDLRNQVQRFWYTLTLIDRLRSPSIRAGIKSAVPLQDLKVMKDAAEHIHQLADSMSQHAPAPNWRAEALADQGAERQSLDRSQLENLPLEQMQQIFALSFACSTIDQEVASLTDHVTSLVDSRSSHRR
ncbi:FUSC family protein (plasmid) [Peteryoungia desertarenae]|uniref:FUSC family protein n=1 Tax=Peteryoungia desertarenae TaxID=1813451 RepID=A0ABX6QSG3_9HYPH|nr:FUSC family protein [Peteryoungia desertarenae]QLF71539.1 FUSC family protein [Peteryoungia desertarenae]